MELSSEYRELLENHTPEYEEFLREHLTSAAWHNRRSRPGKFDKKLGEVFMKIGETNIELKDLTMPWIPEFRIDRLSVDYPMVCLHVDLKPGTVVIHGDYEANNSTLEKVLPITHKGRISITFANVSLSGRIGMSMADDSDSFYLENFDIKYNVSDVTSKVNYTEGSEGNSTVVENEVTTDIASSLAKGAIWNQVQEVITYWLWRDLCDIAVEYSVWELLENDDQPLKNRYKELSAKANKFLDSLLCTAKDYIVSKDLRQISTGGIDTVFRGKPTNKEQGAFSSGPAYISDLTTLTRAVDFSLFEDDEKLVVYGSIKFRDMKYGYENYEIEFGDTKSNGTIKSSIYKTKIFVTISVSKDEGSCSPRVEEVQFRELGDIDMDTSGLGSLTWMENKIKSWVKGNLRYVGIPTVENYIKEALTHAINNTNCTTLLS